MRPPLRSSVILNPAPGGKLEGLRGRRAFVLDHTGAYSVRLRVIETGLELFLLDDELVEVDKWTSTSPR